MSTSGDTRDEARFQRDDRNLMELLQELRVAGLGVQVLFGFLLSLPFTTRFTALSAPQRVLYAVDLLLAALATALLLTPVAYHRLVFRRHLKESLVMVASAMAFAGLVVVGLAICGAVLLVLGFAENGLSGIIAAIFVACVFGTLWFVIPLARRGQAGAPGRRDA